MVSAAPINVAPQIVNFAAESLGGGSYLITGRVIDESPGGLRITLGGSTSASGQFTLTQSDGRFTLIVQLRTDGTDSGFITASTVDNRGLASNVPQQFVTPG
ncbi:MAG TPA: hypothetical protein VKE74_23690 [Gemmataceae bacterium]|nr:hypothetical protein [Gemmataceae bacterium]